MAPANHLGNLRVVLVSTRNPLNIGAAARAMSNFGATHLRVVNPYEIAFREARSAVGASPILRRAEECGNVAEAIADCTLVVGTTTAQDRELHHPFYRLPDAAPLIGNHLASGRVALLFGSEKRGLSNYDCSYCHWLLQIPTVGQQLSMNLGQAVAVCLYELARSTDILPVGQNLAACGADLELLTATLLQSLHISGYIKPRSGTATEEKIRRMVRRWNLSGTDAETLVGMLRKVVWKMKTPGNDSND